MKRVPALLTWEATEWVYLSVDDDAPLSDDAISDAAETYARGRDVELIEVVDWDGGERDDEGD